MSKARHEKIAVQTANCFIEFTLCGLFNRVVRELTHLIKTKLGSL